MWRFQITSIPRATRWAIVGIGFGALSVEAHRAVEAFAPRAETAITVDGELDEWRSIPVTLYLSDSAEVRICWDAEALYLGVSIMDPQIQPSPYEHEIYRGDCLELAIDLHNNSGFDYGADDYQFIVGVPGEEGEMKAVLARHAGSRRPTSDYLEVAGRRTETGYEMELRLDFAALDGFRPEAGSAVGFQVLWQDFRPEQAAAQHAWSPWESPMAEPLGWGDLFLIEGDLAPAGRDALIAGLGEHRERWDRLFRERRMDPVPSRPLADSTRRDMEALRGKLIERLWKPLDLPAIRDHSATIGADGRWDALDYDYHQGAVLDVTFRHLYWLLDMAIAWHFEASPLHRDPALQEAIDGALDHWLRNDYRSSNWWHNEIGVPRLLGNVALLLGDELRPDRRDAIIRILKRAKNEMTGQNLMWINQVIAVRGLLQDNPALIHKALDRIADEVVLTTGEGVQPDFSFHQHDSQLYNHGYGAAFLTDSTALLSCAAGGEFELPKAKLDILCGLALEGSRWMAYGRFADFGANGRGVTREAQSARYLADGAENLLEFKTGREAELRALRVSARGEGPDLLSGHRHFHHSDFSVHRREDYYFSVKMYSRRTIGTESMNGEGLKSYYLPDGCLLVLRKGDEYDAIPPLWNWRLIPGVTCPLSDEPLPSINPRETNTWGTTDFVGGVSDGRNGCSVYDYDRDGLTARKAYFGFDWGMVCLGAGINSESSDPIVTTINQTHLRSPVTVGSAFPAETLELDEGSSRRFEGPRWIHHDDILYLPVGPSRIQIDTTEHMGAWYAINRGQSREVLSGALFTAYFAHGAAPRDAAYAYAVLPNVPATRSAGLADAPPFAVLRNDSAIQAVRDRKANLVEAVFHRPGTLRIDDGVAVDVDQPCVLMADFGGAEIAVSVANPRNEALAVSVALTLDGAPAPVTLLFDLPGDPYTAGSTVTRTIAR